MEKVKILGIDVHRLTLQQALEKIIEFIEQGRPRIVVTANPEIIMRAQIDGEFARILAEAALVTGDGTGVVWASRRLGNPLPERVTGIELLNCLLPIAAQKQYRIYLLGAAPGVAERAARRMENAVSGLTIVGTHHGYLNPELEDRVVADIKEKRPHLLFVAMGAPRQEKWIASHLDELGVPVSIGVGGSLDVWAGEVDRAPVWMQKHGLEWLYRIWRQPARLKRAAVIPKFVLAVLKEGRRLH